MNKEPFAINGLAISNAEHESSGDAVGDAFEELARQIHAHDPSLPADLEGQLRELLARPTESEVKRALVARLMALMPPVEALLGSIETSLGRPLTDADAPLIIATMEEIRRAMVAAMAPADSPVEIGNPFEPPPPPPTKAVGGES